jgi:hypothetical protein
VGVNVILNMALSAGGSRRSGGSSSGWGRAAKAHPVAAARQGVGVMSISKQAPERLLAAIVGRMRDSAEIECVLASSSSHLTALPVFLASIGPPPFPWALMLLTTLAVQRLRSAQMIVYPDFRFALGALRSDHRQPTGGEPCV